jgi:hypothetical protein
MLTNLKYRVRKCGVRGSACRDDGRRSGFGSGECRPTKSSSARLVTACTTDVHFKEATIRH